MQARTILDLYISSMISRSTGREVLESPGAPLWRVSGERLLGMGRASRSLEDNLR